jgi:hypothetical protein
MEDIERAIRAGAEAGKLRQYARQHGEAGLAGLIRLADRHSALATAALKKTAEDATGSAPRPHTVGKAVEPRMR